MLMPSRRLLLFIPIYLVICKNIPAIGQESGDPHQSPFHSQACIENGQYLVVSKSTDAVGDDIFVRTKSTQSAKNECKNNNAIFDYRITKAGEAKYVFGLINNFLILDQGTGPSGRKLVIIDLSTRHEVWSDLYENDPSIIKHTIKFDKFISHGDKNTCTNYKKIVSQNWTPIYIVPSEIKLPGLTVRPLGSPKCIASQ